MKYPVQNQLLGVRTAALAARIRRLEKTLEASGPDNDEKTDTLVQIEELETELHRREVERP